MEIEANDACHLNLSEVVRVNGRIRVPYRIYEDHLVEADFDPCEVDDDYVYYQSPVTMEMIRNKRLRNYHADVWWPELDGTGLLLPSNLVKVTTSVQAVLKAVTYPAFIRSHKASPKDVKSPPIFHTPHEAYHALIQSQRTKNDLSWILWSTPQNILAEVRCFCYKRKLTAMCLYSGDCSQQQLVAGSQWLRQHVNDLPYWDCVVDIALVKDSWYILEINGFGADLNTGGGLFSWYEDYSLLHGLLPFEIRTPDEYNR